MLVAVKRLREIKCFKFLFKSCGAVLQASSRMSVGRTLHAAGPEKENALSPNLVRRRGVEATDFKFCAHIHRVNHKKPIKNWEK